MHQIGRRIQSRQEDDGDILGSLVFLQDYCRIKTTDIGHHNVKQNQIGMLSPCHFDTSGTIVGRTNLEFLVRQKYLQQ